ncbi:MAG: hypothetical protein D6740_09320, partial [Alphaproteobacteria bacterium]
MGGHQLRLRPVDDADAPAGQVSARAWRIHKVQHIGWREEEGERPRPRIRRPQFPRTPEQPGAGGDGIRGGHPPGRFFQRRETTMFPGQGEPGDVGDTGSHQPVLLGGIAAQHAAGKKPHA